MTETYTLPKTYDFHATEQRIYEWWEKSGYFKPANDPNKPGFRPGHPALRHLHPAAQRDRRAAPGPCHVRLDGRPDDPLPPHEGLFHPVGARQRPCRHRHPAAGGEIAGERRPDSASRSGAKNFCAAPGPGRKNTAASSPARSAAWALPAIGTASASPWMRACRSRARSLCAPVRKRPDLPRPAPDQLVARPEDRRLRPGSGILRGSQASCITSSTCWQTVRTNISRSPPRAPRPSWAIRPWRCTPKMSATRNSSGAA